MKKFLIAVLAAAVLMLGSTLGFANMPTGGLPAHIQRMENIVNENSVSYLNFVDYRDTDSTVWIWVDNTGQPGKCNFVVVLGVIDKATDKYVGLLGFNEMNSPDPCGSGYQSFNEYIKAYEAALQNRSL
jgi:hypothetical protein